MKRKKLSPLEHREYYKKYMRKYYRTKIKADKYLQRQKEEKTHLRVQMVEYIQAKPTDYAITKSGKNKPYLYGFFFYSRKQDLIPIECCYTNIEIAKWVAENYGAGIWSMRWLAFSAGGQYRVRFKEVMKMEIKEEQSDYTFRILSVKTRRLNRYWFRKPEFQKQLSNEK